MAEWNKFHSIDLRMRTQLGIVKCQRLNWSSNAIRLTDAIGGLSVDNSDNGVVEYGSDEVLKTRVTNNQETFPTMI
jgi:hypothetical protein